MRTIRVLAAVIAALLVSVPGALAARAELRIITPTRSLLGADALRSGSARSYVDDQSVSHALPASTALGQLFAGSLVGDFGVLVAYSSFGGFVHEIGGVPATGNATWTLFVNDVAATAGPDTLALKAGDKATWLLDPDYTRPGPYFLDLTLLKRSGSTLSLSVRRVDYSKGPVAAVGARVTVNGHRYKVNGRGKVTIRVAGPWFARATLAGAIASQRLFGSK
jgi:hypothetical protein